METTSKCEHHLERIALVGRSADWRHELLANGDEAVQLTFTNKVQCQHCGAVEMGCERHQTLLVAGRYRWRDLAWLAVRKLCRR
jgi:hypothetical protein